MPEHYRDMGMFLARAKKRLRPEPKLDAPVENGVRRAAVIIPVLKGKQGLNVLLTQRSDELPTHAGQVAFPGGKLDKGDASPLAAGLREMHEETGIAPKFATAIGYLDTFSTGTGFSIVPIVAVLQQGYVLVPEPGEVTDIFEVPLTFLMNQNNHQSKHGEWRGEMHQYYTMPYQGRNIWGVTASMVRELSDRLNGEH